MDEEVRENGNNLMMHSWVGRSGPTNPSNKDDWWISDVLKPNSGTQHIHKLSDRVVKKKKDEICKNTHDTHTIASTNRVPKDHLPSRLQRSRGRQRLWQGSNLRLMWMNPCLNYPSPLISYINQLAGSHPSLLQVCPQMSGHWSVLQLECTRSWQLYCTFKN